MSLSQKNLSLVQKAGQALHGASVAIAATVSEQAQSMVTRITSQPFGVESDQAVARFKQLSSLSQGLAAVESKLQELYALAGELANPASDVIMLPDTTQRKAAQNASAVDVVAKPAKATKMAKPSAAKSGALTANDSKLLAFLLRKLKSGKPTEISGAQLVAGSKLPKGSITASLKKIVASGAVKVVGRATYQSGEPVVASADVGTTPKPVKKVKAVPMKAKSARAKKESVTPAATPDATPEEVQAPAV